MAARQFKNAQLNIDTLGLEIGDGGFESEDLNSDEITEPFDPTKIRINTEPMTVSLLVARIKNNEIDMSPDFQRRPGIWKNGAQSRLIESMLIRIPIPAFYFDATNEERWLVVDGLQRLTAINRFVVRDELRLTELEFLKQFQNNTFSELPRSYQRRIEETAVTVFTIQKQTPPAVKFNIFKRINTGGLPLSAQEIRHALNQGKATRLLTELAHSEEFLLATRNGVSDERMGAQECVLRFVAFYMIDIDQYRDTDFDQFLNQAMQEINQASPSELANLRAQFTRAMTLAHDVFGVSAFRKQSEENGRNVRRGPINKALFEACAVNLAHQSTDNASILIKRKAELNERFGAILEERKFADSISQATGNPTKVRYRFNRLRELLEEII